MSERGACAVCLQAISHGDRFALVGCEVVHRDCLPQIERSRSSIMAAKIIRLTAEVARERQEASRKQVVADDAENLARAARRARDVALADAAQWKALYESGVASTQDALGQARAAMRRRDEMKAMADAANNDLRLHVALGSMPAVANRSPATEIDDRDDASVRFSLLELDRTCENDEPDDTEITGDRDGTTQDTEEARVAR